MSRHKISLAIARYLSCFVIILSNAGDLVAGYQTPTRISARVATSAAKKASNLASKAVVQKPIQGKLSPALSAASKEDGAGSAAYRNLSVMNKWFHDVTNILFRYDTRIKSARGEMEILKDCLRMQPDERTGDCAGLTNEELQKKIDLLQERITKLEVDKNRIVTVQQAFYSSLPALGGIALLAGGAYMINKYSSQQQLKQEQLKQQQQLQQQKPQQRPLQAPEPQKYQRPKRKKEPDLSKLSTEALEQRLKKIKESSSISDAMARVDELKKAIELQYVASGKEDPNLSRQYKEAGEDLAYLEGEKRNIELEIAKRLEELKKPKFAEVERLKEEKKREWVREREVALERQKEIERQLAILKGEGPLTSDDKWNSPVVDRLSNYPAGTSEERDQLLQDNGGISRDELVKKLVNEWFELKNTYDPTSNRIPSEVAKKIGREAYKEVFGEYPGVGIW